MAENKNQGNWHIEDALKLREEDYKKAKESQKKAEELLRKIKEIKSIIRYNNENGIVDKQKLAQLKNLQEQLRRQNEETRKLKSMCRVYGSLIKDEVARVADKQMKEDAAKANEEKKKLEQRDKQLAVARKRITDMRAAVKKKAEELGKDIKMEELRDSKGNRIFTFKDKDGKYIGVMSAKRGKPLGEYIDATKSAELQALCQDAKDMSKNKKANLAQMIDIIDNRAKLEADIANSKGNKDKSSDKQMSAADLQKFAKPMTIQEIEASLKKSKEMKALETKAVPKSVKTPEVRLIPKKRRNGEDSKRHFEAIELVDANGNSFKLTKKMMKEAVKQQGNSAASRSEMVDYSWDNYVEAAKEGKLRPEQVASFFKGQANMGETQVDETTKSTATPSINATLAVDNKMEDTVKAADQTINRIGIMRYRNNQRGG